MALESTTDAAEAWRVIRGNAKAQRAQVSAFIITLNAGDVTLETVLEMYRVIYNSMNQLNTLAATANLNSYVQSTSGNGTYDAAAEIAAVTALQQACLTWIDTNAAGLSLTGDTAANWLSSGSVVSNRFGKPATAGLRAAMQDVVDAIAV